MKLRSLYEYFQAYFDYSTTSNVRYGREISEVMKITGEMMKLKSVDPITQYESYKYSNPISIQMLYKLLDNFKNNYKDPFNEIQYVDTMICINKGYLDNGRRELKIPLQCGFDASKNAMIYLTFSSNYNIKQEMEVLKGLLIEFGNLNKNLIDAEKVIYWNLSKNGKESIGFKDIKPVSREKLILAANKALNTK